MRIRSLRPDRQYIDRGDEHWRPAVVLSINGASATIRVLMASGFVRQKTVETSALPNPGVGAPLCVRVSSTNPDTFSIAEYHAALWARGYGPHDEAAVAAGPLWPVMPRELTQEPLTWWTA
jgi:hypothetical protein